VVVTEHSAAAGEGILLELAGLFVVAQSAQVAGKVVGRGQGVGVVVAQYPTEAGEGVLLELAGLFVLAQHAQLVG
jgi:hypothetical protein